MLLLAVAASAGWVQGIRAENIASKEPVAPERGSRHQPLPDLPGVSLGTGADPVHRRKGSGGEHPGPRRKTLLVRTALPLGRPRAARRRPMVAALRKDRTREQLQRRSRRGTGPCSQLRRSVPSATARRPHVGFDDRYSDTEGGSGRPGRTARRRRRAEPENGRRLAAASNPSYEPNDLASNDQNVADRARCELGLGLQRLSDGSLQKDAEGNPVPVREPRVPNSVGRSSGTTPSRVDLQSRHGRGGARVGQVHTGHPFDRRAALPTPRRVRRAASRSTTTARVVAVGSLANALRVSCNTAFAQVAVDIGADQLYEHRAGSGPGPVRRRCIRRMRRQAVFGRHRAHASRLPTARAQKQERRRHRSCREAIDAGVPRACRFRSMGDPGIAFRHGDRCGHRRQRRIRSQASVRRARDRSHAVQRRARDPHGHRTVRDIAGGGRTARADDARASSRPERHRVPSVGSVLR